MTLRVATWNMRGWGALTPEDLVRLILQPGVSPRVAGTQRPNMSPIHLLLLQEVPLMFARTPIQDALARCNIPDAQHYEVSQVANSQTKSPQNRLKLRIDTGRGPVSRDADAPSPETNDGYMIIYDARMVAPTGGAVFSGTPLKASEHHTLCYIRKEADTNRADLLTDGQKGLMVKTTTGGGRTTESIRDSSDIMHKAMFGRRPLDATVRVGRQTINLLNWHAPEGGGDKDLALPALQLFDAFNFAHLDQVDVHKYDEIILFAGDFNLVPGMVASYSNTWGINGRAWQHVHRGSWDQILMCAAGKSNAVMTRVDQVANVLDRGTLATRPEYSDHQWIVADVDGHLIGNAPTCDNLLPKGVTEYFNPAPTAGSKRSAGTGTHKGIKKVKAGPSVPKGPKKLITKKRGTPKARQGTPRRSPRGHK